MAATGVLVRRGSLAAVLLGVALWPLAHRAVVAHFDVNPWKLGGFAMYATPAPPVLVAVLRAVPGGFRPIDPRTFSAPVQEELESFQLRRHALGTLHEPKALAAAVLAEHLELPAVVVMVQRMKLDPQTALMTSRRDRYVYNRIELE